MVGSGGTVMSSAGWEGDKLHQPASPGGGPWRTRESMRLHTARGGAWHVLEANRSTGASRSNRNYGAGGRICRGGRSSGHLDRSGGAWVGGPSADRGCPGDPGPSGNSRTHFTPVQRRASDARARPADHCQKRCVCG
ncbi:hypothetical protein D9X30_1179 [Cupriavidus sp. U2]|nr:hypothetical protein D9X30_1179 [Cupriavidus sp. U2]